MLVNKIMIGMIDQLHDSFILHAETKCTAGLDDDETCYSAKVEGAWCFYCDIHKAFIGLVDALSGNETKTECPRCYKYKSDVEKRYSFTIYAGKMCEDCAISGFTDQCGIGRRQGTQAEIDETIEPADYY